MKIKIKYIILENLDENMDKNRMNKMYERADKLAYEGKHDRAKKLRDSADYIKESITSKKQSTHNNHQQYDQEKEWKEYTKRKQKENPNWEKEYKEREKREKRENNSFNKRSNIYNKRNHIMNNRINLGVGIGAAAGGIGGVKAIYDHPDDNIIPDDEIAGAGVMGGLYGAAAGVMGGLYGAAAGGAAGGLVSNAIFNSRDRRKNKKTMNKKYPYFN